MARADLILSLIRAGGQGDQLQFQKIVEALAADERAKNHPILADRILSHLHAYGNGKYRSRDPSPTRNNPGPFVSEVAPTRSLESLILPSDVHETVLELVDEQNRADLLRSYGLEPRNRVLLAGPPGNGKTCLAEAIAHAINVPLVVVRYEAVIASYLGETSQRIAQVFDHARSRNCVLFFDEFDAVGKERGDLHETGEIKRVVSSLLLQIDNMPSYVVVVTASNHPELLDRAVWRRFQVRLELPMPKQGQIEEWFRRFEKQTGHKLGRSPRSLAQSLRGLSFSEVEGFGTDVVRRIVLDYPGQNTKGITERCLRRLKHRYELRSSDVHLSAVNH